MYWVIAVEPKTPFSNLIGDASKGPLQQWTDLHGNSDLACLRSCPWQKAVEPPTTDRAETRTERDKTPACQSARVTHKPVLHAPDRQNVHGRYTIRGAVRGE